VYVPAVDIFETTNDMTVMVDMPGVAEQSVSIDLNNDELTISGTMAEEAKTETMLLQEYQSGDYYRQFNVSRAIDRNQIEASISNGVLKIVLPKAEIAKPRKIDIKTT